MLSPRAAAATVCLGLTLSAFVLLFPLGNPAAPAAAPGPAVLEAVPAELAPQLYLEWVRDLPVLRPAWPDQPLLQFDIAYQPVVVGGRGGVTPPLLFLASSQADGVAAFDAETGVALWRFFTDGPVRFAPAVWDDKVYFASDDGWLYCVSADRGALVWKFRGAPSDRKVLGNGRLISAWPARGAPVVAPEPNGEAVVYVGAGIWPFMGVFLHALDARTGAVRWTNGGDGSLYIKQPHMVDAFGGVAPQGRMAVVGDRLLVPCGRSIPACYDRRTGKLLHFRLADDSKLGGGAEVVAGPGFFVSGGGAFDLGTGTYLGAVGDHAVLAGARLLTATPTELRAYDLARFGPSPGANATRFAVSAVVPLPGIEALTATSSRVYLGTVGRVFAVDRPLAAGRPRISWEAAIEGRPVHLLTADGRLFVSTREGRLYCFGAAGGEILTHPLPSPPDPPPDDGWTDRARDLLDATGARDGYGVAWGVGSGRLVEELLRQSRLHMIVVEPDADRAKAFRDAMCDAGLYGERVAVVQAPPEFAELPPYLAELMVSEDLGGVGAVVGKPFLSQAFVSLRPYGGTACLPMGLDDQAALSDLAAGAGLANVRIGMAGDWVLLSREGPLPGAADWTHEHADAANTRVSRDRIVRTPLGLLWFGGPSHDGILPRHGHGPQPQVMGGRLFIEGVDILRAVDVYTGRLLWEASLPGVGKAYDSAFHQPGANAGGSNYVSAADGVYVAYGTTCVRLDPASGRQVQTFTMPLFPGEKNPPVWDWVTLDGDLLIGGADPGPHPNPPPPAGGGQGGGATVVAASKRLCALDRNSGELRWTLTAQTAFRHNAVCVGGGRLYAIDRPSAEQADLLKRRGETPGAKPRLVAVDLRTGKPSWTRTDGVFGSWLSYSDKYDILVEAGRNARDTLSDEPKGMRAYRASDGKPLWSQPNCSGPAMIHGDTVLRDGGGCDLRTGAPTMQPDPLTGAAVEWAWSRNYGCNTPAASENLLTFRSGAAGYYDLADCGGTGNLGGFRSSCTNNLIVADGLLNAPDYTRGCTCSYQNQASLAMAPMPDAEEWTFFPPREVKGVVRKVGVNLGAPGCRKADDGVLWVEYPPVGGTDERPGVSVSPNNVDWFRRHSSQVEGDGPVWVGASGGKGLRSLTVTLSRDPTPARSYTVSLWFMEPDDLRGGRRVFDVALQGQGIMKEFEPFREAGGVNRIVRRDFRGVRAGRDLTVTLTPSGADTTAAPLLCGVEVEAEGW